MGIIFTIKIKLLSYEYIVNIRLPDIKMAIGSGLIRARSHLTWSLGILHILGKPLRDRFIATIQLIPRINIINFKFKEEYTILVNTDRELAPYLGKVKKLLSERTKNIRDLKSIIVLQGRDLDDKLNGNVNILIMTDGRGYAESINNASEGRILKTITVGAGSFSKAFPNLTLEILASRGLILYGDEFLKELIALDEVGCMSSYNGADQTLASA